MSDYRVDLENKVKDQERTINNLRRIIDYLEKEILAYEREHAKLEEELEDAYRHLDPGN